MEKRKPYILKVLEVLMNGHFDGLQKDTLHIISPRNLIYEIEKHINEKIERKEVKSVYGTRYTEYRIPNSRIMKKAIELYRAKGGELSPSKENHILKRFNEQEQQGSI